MDVAKAPSPTRFAGHLSPASRGEETAAETRASPPRPHFMGERWPAKRVGEGENAQARAYAVAAAVVDPEIPVLTIADLGILRSVEIENGVAVAKLTPTYSGCPAVLAIELAVEAALLDAGFQPRIERVLSPAWTTDWITSEGRAKLKEYGIAPPEKASNSIRALFGETQIECPHCGSHDTTRISEFGSTACKALYRCETCREPFDYFKCI